MTISLVVTLVTVGGEESAEIAEVNGETVLLHSASSAPPGSTLSFLLPSVDSPYKVKVRGCRKVATSDERPFRIEGRLFDLTRHQRAALLASFG